MANDVENKDNEIDDDSINIDDIEGLERDLPSEEKPSNNDSLSATSTSEEKDEPLEILEGGKLKSAAPSMEESISTEEDTSKQKNKKSIKILLLILFLLIIGIVAFIFLSDSEDANEEKTPPPTTQATPLPPIETYEFKLDHINVARLNKKLGNLTKYELLGMTEEEYLKEEKAKAIKKAEEEEALKEKMRAEQEAIEKEALEKEALEQARIKEESAQQTNKQATSLVDVKDNNETEQTAKESEAVASNEASQTQEESEKLANKGNEFLKFIQVNTHQKSIYKTYLKQIHAIDERVHACRNINNNIEVFIGPLKSDENYQVIIDAIKKEKLSNDVIFTEITSEEFSVRCMVDKI